MFDTEEEYMSLIKLVSGEEIVAMTSDIQEDDDVKLVMLNHPCKISTISNPKGYGVKFDHWMKFSDDFVYSKFLTPKDLNETFLFPKGNIDHSTMTGQQNFDKRTFSSKSENFYSYYDYKSVYYCGAGSFPCGSVAGTPGYMCSKQIINNNEQ